MSKYLQEYKRFVRLIQENDKSATYILIDNIQSITSYIEGTCNITMHGGNSILVAHTVDETVHMVDEALNNMRR